MFAAHPRVHGLMLKRAVRSTLRRVKNWLAEEKVPANIPAFVPCDNRPEWLRSAFQKIVQDPVCARRPYYIWGVVQAVALGRCLGLKRISVLQFGMAAGAGLIALQQIQAQVDEMVE